MGKGKPSLNESNFSKISENMTMDTSMSNSSRVLAHTPSPKIAEKEDQFLKYWQ